MNHSLWLYFLLVVAIVAVPGMDMAYVVSSAWAGGARCAAAAIAGIVAGGIVHVLTATIGITALLASFPHVLRGLALAGAAYMAWIGWRFLRTRPTHERREPRPPPRSASVFRYGAVTCLVNPKAYAFMLAVFPSFIHSEGRTLVLRAAAMSGITAATQTAVYGAAAVAALRMHRRFAPEPAVQTWTQRAVGVIMVISAVILAYGWIR
jgi:threonine/homoserine/homoserine lactone efflux protein